MAGGDRRGAAAGVPLLGTTPSQFAPFADPGPRHGGADAAPATLRIQLRGLHVAIRHRRRPGKATTLCALPPINPVFSARLGLRVASPRRLRPGRVMLPSALTTPSPALGRSVLKPLASPRRLTRGRALMPRGAHPHVAGPATGALRIAAVSPPAGQGLVTAIHPSAASDLPAGTGQPGPAEGTPALAGGNRWAGTDANAGFVLIGCPADRLTTAPDTRPGDRAHALTTPSPVLWRSVLKPLASPRRLTPGRAFVPVRRPPRCWSRYGGSPYRGRRPTRRAGPGYRDSS